ncbi:Zn(II)2Cys6 transcription factor [Aspergillus brunneoviolaceus CBS 621.78]|uniref:Uncharacterized protein n=1 Tax=Aspergillus brunneoviolaceus CBS 621.78 TaxID=1450534 RepID=A0ACD1FY08_9EURO|nr:hypothetical protein BO95DRAFT_446579 [Aspergillus brunneoviolaceus CBS 621.78]RAH41858.1 hypothetical protein BO95DRAFT_446579 [Aspergillus brunneoviolaceus CBS 621.78]
MMDNAITEHTEHTSPQRKKATPACEKCRVLKVKCVQSGEGQPCTKCARSNSQCVFPAPRQRPRVLQRAKPRLIDLESKLTNIIGLLSRSKGPVAEMPSPLDENSGPPAMPEYPDDRPGQTVEWMSEAFLPDSAMTAGPKSSEDQNALESPRDAPTAIDTAWITNTGLNPVVLEHLLDRFRGMASYFPFVQLPCACTAASMAESRPFLLLAAVGVASSDYCHLQHALIGQFKRSLSERAILAGEKNLDLLQGLLVHLAWFHFSFIPGSQQAYQYLQIAISMVIDLRLDQETADVVEQRNELTDVYARDACRAYLGCYYMSSIIAMSSGKPNNLRFHKDMLRCAKMLHQEPEPEFETDHLIYPITQVLQFNEDVCETHRSEGIYSPRLYIYAERFTTRLEEWWSSLSTEVRNNVLLIDRYYAVKIRIEEMGLVYCYGQRRPPSRMAQRELTILSAHPMVISHLTDCVSSAKDYLDIFCALPAAAQRRLPFSTWYQVVLAVFVLYRLSVGLPEVPQWNVDIARETVDLQEYTDQLLSHLQGIAPLSDRQIPTTSLFSRMPEIMQSVRTSYALAKENGAPVRDSRHAHHDLASVNRTASSTPRLHRCPAVRYSSRSVAPELDLPTLQSAIATEVRSIEDEKLWGDLFLMDTLSSMTGSSSIGL